ncbi:MAG: O-antigen ligase family protein [Oscillospiraceae bacterium]|nr:O-antigen ligase family protein [Oscillospiraceae bacterium]
MKRMLEKKKNPLFAVLITFLLGYFLICDLDIRYIYIYALLGVFLCINIFTAGIWRPGVKLGTTLRTIWNRVTPIKMCFFFIVTLITILTLLPSSNKSHLTISLMISMLIFAAYLLFMEPGKESIRCAFCAIHVMSILFTCYIIVVMLWPDLFWENIYLHLSSVSQEQAALLIPMGYGVPLGGSSTYTDYILTIALLVNLSEVFVEGIHNNRKRFWFVVISSAFYAAGILLMGRRSEVLAMGVAGLLMLILHAAPTCKGDTWRKFSSLLMIFVLFVVILLPFVAGGYMQRYSKLIEAIFPQYVLNTEDKMQEIPIDANQLTSGRLILWKQALQLFKEKPVFGIGWEQFMTQNTYEHEVHNTYLQWLCESGIVGFILLMIPTMLMYAMTIKRTIRYRRKNREVPFGIKQMNFVSLGMHTFLLAVNLIDPAYYHLNYFCFYALVICLEDTAGRLELESTVRS